MVSLLLSILRLSLASSITCESFFCHDDIRGDGICNTNCNNFICGFDTKASSSTNLDLIEKFRSSDCYELCLNLGCLKENLGNNKCDEPCNNEYCAWDLNDCGYCSPGCTLELISNKVCDPECDNFNCGFDDMLCSIACGESCTKDLLFSSTCQPECQNENCLKLYPNSTCFVQCSKKCDFSVLGDGICDIECNNLDCLFDLDDCRVLGC